MKEFIVNLVDIFDESRLIPSALTSPIRRIVYIEIDDILSTHISKCQHFGSGTSIISLTGEILWHES